MHAIVTLSRFFGFLALRLYAHGPLPENAFHTSSNGQRTTMSQGYRTVWRVGQVIGWTLVAATLLALAALLSWLLGR